MSEHSSVEWLCCREVILHLKRLQRLSSRVVHPLLLMLLQIDGYVAVLRLVTCSFNYLATNYLCVWLRVTLRSLHFQVYSAVLLARDFKELNLTPALLC